MDNQHKLIKGYRDLSEVEIAAMNEIKALGEQVGALIDSLGNRPALSIDKRWLAIAKTDLQTGFMAAVRSIAQPGSF